MITNTVPLKRLFDLVTGGSWGQDPEEAPVVLPCVRGTDFDYDHLGISRDSCPSRGFSEDEVRLRAAVAGDIIIEKSGGGDTQPVGRAVLWQGPGLVMPTNFAARLRPSNDVEPRFATYLLAALYASGRTRAAIKQTTGIQNLDLDAFLATPVWRRPRSQQRLVADLLDRETSRIERLIAAKTQNSQALVARWEATMAAGVGGRLLTKVNFKPSRIPWLPMIPEHWREVKLNLVARLGSGHTPSRSHPEWWADTSIPWITTGEVEQFRSDRVEYVFETRELISELGMANSAATLHPAGTVVLCRTASAGYSAIMGRDMATSQDFATWTCGPLVLPRFVLLCLRVMRNDLLGRLAMGSTHQTIYMPDIASIKIPLPPIDDQHSVIESVYKVFPVIDRAIAALDRQIDLIRERKQALIAAMVMDQLARSEVRA